MLRSTGFLLGSSLALFAACQRADAPAATTPDVSSAPPVLSGTWRVDGVTVEKASGKTRQISGTIILVEEQGGKFRSTFDLDTILPTAGGPTRADVIGEGEGSITGRQIAGTSRTQIVIAGAPNIDPSFAFVPRRVGTRIVSSTKGTLVDDGTIALEIESEPAPGETYAATRTTLKGSLVEPPRTPSAP